MEWFYLAFISAILSAFAAVLQKKVLFDLDALEFSFILGIFNLVFAFFLLPQVNFDSLSTLGIIILYLKTILGALAFWNVMLAIKNMEISGALPLMVLTPAIVAVLSLFILGESLTGIEIVGMIILLLGTYILELKKNDKFIDPIKTLINSTFHKYIFYALLLFSISSVIDKLILNQYKLSAFNFVLFQQIFLGINFTLLVFIKSKNPIAIFGKISKNNIGWIIVISIITIGYRYTQIEAVKIAPVALVLSIKRTSVFFASILGGKLFRETLLFKKGIAILIMLLGAYFLT